LGIPIKIWDMGGQKEYRKEYLSKLHYFDGTKLLFYVIDIQDPARFDIALDYFESIVNNFVALELSPKIVVLLHKCDQALKDSMQLNKNIYKIRHYLSSNLNFKDILVYETSIYTPEEFYHIFVQAIFEIFPGGHNIQQLLTQFKNDIKAEAIQIVDENLLIIAEDYSNKKSQMVCRICGKNLTNMAKDLYEVNWRIPDRIGIEIDGWVFFKYVPYLETRFYLIFFTKMEQSLRDLTNFLPKFLNDLSHEMDTVV
jgi:hypothetical protein